MRLSAALTLAVLLTATAACRSARITAGVTRSDSAGVQIVENRRVTARIPQWSLSARPGLDIGVVEGPEEYRLFRVSDAKRLPDDGVLVLNLGTQQVRRYDSVGTFMYSFGREGDGPGEFGAPTQLYFIEPDSVAVWDRRLRRIALFTLDGTFVRNIRPERQAADPVLAAAFDDGTYLIRDYQYPFIPPSGFAEAQFTLTRYSSSGKFLDSAGTYYRALFGTLGDPGLVGGPLFSPVGSIAGETDGFWVGSGRTYEVRRYVPAGALKMLVRWQAPSRDIHREDVDAYWKQSMADLSGNALRQSERLRKVRPVAGEFPAYGAIEASSGGGLWIEEYPRPRAPNENSWWVFAPGGAMVATVSVPASLQMTEIEDDAVLGIERDSLDVEHVRLYRIERP